MKDLDTTKKQVEECLEKYPATRDNLMYLIISVWKNHHKEDFIDFLKKSIMSMQEEVPGWMHKYDGSMFNLPKFESIRRTAQKVQNTEGKFPPSADVKAAREQEETTVRDWSRK